MFVGSVLTDIGGNKKWCDKAGRNPKKRECPGFPRYNMEYNSALYSCELEVKLRKRLDLRRERSIQRP